MGRVRQSNRLNVDDESRRDFLKWMVLTGGVMQVKPEHLFGVMEDVLGTAHAQGAASTVNKSLHIAAGTGALARFTLLWPQPNLVSSMQSQGMNDTQLQSSNIPLTQAVNSSVTGTARPLFVNAHSPWRNLPGGRQVACMYGGANIVHAEVPISNTTFASGGAGSTRSQASLFAAAAVLQARDSPAPIPVMTVDAIRAGDAQPFGSAPGSNTIPVARTSNFPGLVDMLASEAARPGKVIGRPQNAALLERYYQAMKRLDPLSNNQSFRVAYASADQALGVMVQQLASRLAPSVEDVDRYLGLATLFGTGTGNATAAERVARVDGGSGTDSSAVGTVRNSDLARTLVLAARAMKLGVTNMVMCPAFNDDPHGLFGNFAAAANQTFMTGNSLNEFLADCGTPDPMDPNNRTIADKVVVHIYGDCMKNPVDKSGWPDNPARGSCVSMVLGQGWVKSGWWGGMSQTTANNRTQDTTIELYNPLVPDAPSFTASDSNDGGNRSSAQLGTYSAAAVLYAICDGNLTKWRQFYSGEAIPGLINFDRG